MNRTAQVILRIALIVLLAFFACLIFPRRTAEAEQPRKTVQPSAKKRTDAPAGSSIQRSRNIGKAYYEQGKYAEAIGEFQKVIASEKAVAADHLNLGLALMQANKLDEALGALTTAKQIDPKLPAADYNLGILYKRELRYPDAEAALKSVIETDPHDPAAWFNLGTVFFAQKKLEEALDAHKHVLEMGFGRGQNFYVASLFHTFTTLVRLKRQAEAQKYLKVHEKMRNNVPNISLQNPALEGGRYGAILVALAPARELAKKAAPEKVTFADITARLGITTTPAASPRGTDLAWEIRAADYSPEFACANLAPRFGSSVALGDSDGDGRTDLYFVNPAGTNSLYRNNGDGTFTDVTEKAGVAGKGASLSAIFADYNNSGHASLIVAGMDGVTLFRNKGDGTFVDETEKAGLKGQPGELATGVAVFDADSDGLLDLVVAVYTDFNSPPSKPTFSFPEDFIGAAPHFYRNNGDGTFADVTSSSGLSAAKGRTRGALFADFDNDGASDLLLVRDDDSPLLFINQGEAKFVNRTSEAGPALAKAETSAAQVADFNHDGNFDLCLWSRSGYQVLLNRGGARFVAATNLPPIAPPAGTFGFRGTIGDLNGDGFEDLVAADSGGKLRLLANRAGKFEEANLSVGSNRPQAFATLTTAWLSEPGKLDLVATMLDGQLAAFEQEGPRARWLEVKLGGFKSNTQGIGTVVEVKAGNFYNKVTATGGPVRIFAGSLAKLDVLRVTWPNQVIQNSIDVATNRPIEMRESERLASSCPLLYIWDGQQFVFLTDVLGTAPLGEPLPEGGRIKPYPEEFVRLPENLRDQNGTYVFQITDELREVDYVDQVRLVAVDHPKIEEIYANEIFSSNPGPPTLHAVHEKRLPISAVDDHGHDVLPLIRDADGRYPTDFRRNRMLGLADLHTLTLDLGEFPDLQPVSLWLKGWVFWTDSNAHRALSSNSELRLVMPYLQVLDKHGQWVTVIGDMGLPSGTNRAVRVDLTGKFRSADHHARIVTNLCVYWDQIFVTTGEGSVPVAVELPLVSADLHYRGFSTPVHDPAHMKPDHFEYTRVMEEAPWNPARGRYTRYGAVASLLHRADDRLAVMAPGDELTVRFNGRGLPPLKPGWKRSFFLYTHGWAKDGEPNTAFAKTVAPLPFREMSNYPPSESDRAPGRSDYLRYLEEYQTRPHYSLIPPLAPAIH